MHTVFDPLVAIVNSVPKPWVQVWRLLVCITFISTGWAGESSERRKSQCVKIVSNQRIKKTSCDKCGVTAGPAVQRNKCCMLTHPDTLLSLCHFVKCNIIIGLLWKVPA